MVDQFKYSVTLSCVELGEEGVHIAPFKSKADAMAFADKHGITEYWLLECFTPEEIEADPEMLEVIKGAS